jgi:hypothetical protein
MANNPVSPYTSIISHFDLDGVSCAALCSNIFGINTFRFTGPASVDREVIDEKTIICDLPYPRPCGLWFDHHMTNQNELALRKIDLSKVPGKLANKPSCLRVVYEHFLPNYEIEEWDAFVKEVDVVDGFLYASAAEWQRETPAKIIDYAIKYNSSDGPFLSFLAGHLRDYPYPETAKLDAVAGRAKMFRASEKTQIDLIAKTATFLDPAKEIICINLSEIQNPPNLLKALAFTLFPGAKAALEVHCLYSGGQKTNNLYFSMSLGFVDENVRKKKDLGEIFRTLHAGDGHPGSAAGRINCESKTERLQKLSKALATIVETWSSQKEA